MITVVAVDEATPADRSVLHHDEAWHLEVTGSATEAIASLERRQIDVIISGHRLIDADGRTFLQTVQQRWPHVVRVLAGRDGEETGGPADLRTPWPNDESEMATLVFQAASLRGQIGEETLSRLFPLIDRLPSSPPVTAELAVCLGSRNATPRQVAGIVCRDAGLLSTILRYVNSPWAGMSRNIASIEEAVVLLGFSTIRHIVLAAEVEQLFPSAADSIPDLPRLARHGFACGLVAAALVTDPAEREIAMTAGVLLDAGQLALACLIPEIAGRHYDVAAGREVGVHDIERVSMGFTHAAAGALLLDQWDIPRAIGDAVRGHHDLHAPDTSELDAGHAVVAARLLLGLQTPFGDPSDPLLPSDAEPWQRLFANQPLACQRLLSKLSA